MDKNSTIQFESKASPPQNGVALIYDLEGFSMFFNQPDVQEYVPKYFNHVSKAMSHVIYGGETYFTDEIVEPLLAPRHEKFLGDGALYVWAIAEEDDVADFTIRLCNRLWHVKNKFHEVVKRAADDVPVYEVPRKIRFGLARGTVYELKKGDGESEFIGFCLNLASRLQNYCPQLGFIASARLGIPQAVLDEYDYIKVVATQIKGFPKEIVLVDNDEFQGLDEKLRSDLFELIE
jgi:class 3 adenylate cyclase